MGLIVLPTVLYLSKVLAKLAMGLDRRPELIAHILRGAMDGDENIEKVTLVEQSANVVREAFIKCLTDRTGTPGPQGKPEGKRVGIYLMANLCLKLLFQVCAAHIWMVFNILSRNWRATRTDLLTSAASCEMLNKCSPALAPSPLL